MSVAGRPDRDTLGGGWRSPESTHPLRVAQPPSCFLKTAPVRPLLPRVAAALGHLTRVTVARALLLNELGQRLKPIRNEMRIH